MRSITFRVALALGAAAGCTPAEPPPPDSPWTLEDYAPNTDDGVRVLVLHDMEGLAGQADPRSFNFGTDLYPTGQEWLAADVNAVIAGLFAGGATEVHVVDGHGSGNQEPDVRADLLDPRATQVLRDAPFDTYFDMPELATYDAVAVVGMHAKTGSGGFASHTFTLGIGLLINGQTITETELVGLSWGRVGVPVIFASGDDRLARDLETMPWIEYVTVKSATSASTAEPRPVEEARAALTEGATRAVRNLASAKIMRVNAPITAGLHAVPPADLRFLADVPGIDYHEDVVSFVSDDMRAAYDGLVAWIGVARQGYSGVLLEELRQRPETAAVLSSWGDALSRRWFDQESGRYQRPDPPQRTADPARRYHGYR